MIQEHSGVSPLESDIPPLMSGKPRNRRGAVSGSVMTEEQATSYVKKVSTRVARYKTFDL